MAKTNFPATRTHAASASTLAVWYEGNIDDLVKQYVAVTIHISHHLTDLILPDGYDTRNGRELEEMLKNAGVWFMRTSHTENNTADRAVVIMGQHAVRARLENYRETARRCPEIRLVLKPLILQLLELWQCFEWPDDHKTFVESTKTFIPRFPYSRWAPGDIPTAVSTGRKDKISIGPVNHNLYIPKNANGTLLIAIHGGGYCLGHPDDMFNRMTHIAAATGVTVLILEYRLAPEHPLPGPTHDVIAALEWAFTKFDRIQLIGESAGAHATLVACIHESRTYKGAPRILAQHLVAPVINMNSSPYDPLRLRHEAPGTITTERLHDYQQKANPDPSKLRPYENDPRTMTQSDIQGMRMCKTYIYPAQHDPLYGEALEMRDKLEAGGQRVECHVVHDTYHGSWNICGVDACGKELHDLITDNIKREV